MKNFLATCLALMISIYGFSQHSFIVSGKVRDKATGLPLQSASVFAENTTFGTATNANGDFKIWLPTGGYDLIVTYTGYETGSRRITSIDSNNNNIVIELKVKEKAMEEIAVVASNEVKDGWEKYGDFYKENFIGKTFFSNSCVIENPEVLKFYFNKKRNRLKVKSDTPLQIKNEALGYKIKYSLDSFTYEYNTNICTYSGNPLFEEMQPSGEEQNATWQQNRSRAYKGSILHFMKSVYSRSLKEEGFDVQFLVKNEDKDTAIAIKNLYSGLNYTMDDTTGLVEIMPNQQQVAIFYTSEQPEKDYLASHPEVSDKFQLSFLTLPAGQTIGIEPNGYYFEQNDLTLAGYWDWQKVADMLPYDYKP